MFSFEISEIFKNTFFTEHLRWLLLTVRNNPVIVIILTGTSQSESIITITITLNRRKNPASNFKNTKSNEGSYIDSILNLRIVNNNRKTAFLEKKNYFKFSWLMQKQRFSIEVYVTFNFRKTQSMFESHYSTSNSQLNLYHMQKQ